MIVPKLAKVKVNRDLHSIPATVVMLPKHEIVPGIEILDLWYVKHKNADPDL